MKALKQWLHRTVYKNRYLFFSVLLFMIICPANFYAAVSHPVQTLIRPNKIYQGDVALIKVFPPQNIQSIHYTTDNQSFDFYLDKKDDCYYSLLAIDMDDHPGKKEITINVKCLSGFETKYKLGFEVIKKKFPTQRLTLPESKVTLSNKNLTRHNREKKIIKRVFENANPEKLWNNNFRRPNDGRVSTQFGVKRVLNNKPRNSHSGIDLKAPAGSPVFSSGDGIVAFAGDHFFTGKSVYIDHGMGIVSMYFHLSSVLADKGEMVSKGQKIGLVGSTGRSTGPHLHWGIRINNRRVDPFSLLKLFDETPGT